jgi:hypothetical protein
LEDFNNLIEAVLMAYIILFFVLCFPFAIEINAEESAVYVLGGGHDSCGKWLESKDIPQQRQQYTQWVLGFISGSNWARDETQVYPPDVQAVVAFIDRYCKKNPLQRIMVAAVALVIESLQSKR